MPANSSDDSKPSKLIEIRRKYPFVNHLVQMQEHYGEVRGNLLAGAATYFGFLSFFPVLAIAFSVVGYVAKAYPDAEDSLVKAITQIFPGIISAAPHPPPGTISVDSISGAAGAAAGIGFVTMLYSGLGWLSGMREALEGAFALPKDESRSFMVGKAIDLAVLAILGIVLIVSVGLSGGLQGFTTKILEWVQLDGTLIGPVLVYLVSVLLGLAASTFLFFVIYKLLGHPDLPSKVVWQGALFGAIGFEILKLIVVKILGGVGGSAFAPLAIALTLVVWINYFSRLVVYGAAWAMTSPHSLAALEERYEDEYQEQQETVAETDERERDLLLPMTAAQLTVDERHGLVGTAGGDGDEAKGRRSSSDGESPGFDAGSLLIGAGVGALVAWFLGND